MYPTTNQRLSETSAHSAGNQIQGEAAELQRKVSFYITSYFKGWMKVCNRGQRRLLQCTTSTSLGKDPQGGGEQFNQGLKKWKLH